MSNTLGPSPGTLKYPDHTVGISTDDGRWAATINDRRVADSRDALVVDETGYEQVIYFPRQDDRTELFDESDSRTTCPFKGEAHYFAADVDGKTQDIAWFYPSVYNEVAAIAGYVAFYTDRVSVARAEHSA